MKGSPMISPRRLLATSLFALGLGGCTLGPDFTPPEAALPTTFAYADGAATGADDAAQMDAWWAGFADPVLAELVAIARRDNLDLRMAAARIEQARYGLAATRGLGLPSVQAVGSASVTRLSENSGIGALASAFGGGASAGSGTGGSVGGSGSSGQGIGAPGSTFESYSAGFDARWELDLFGKARRTREAARAEVEQAVWNERAAQVSIAAETARTYFMLRSIGAQIALDEGRLADLRRSQEIGRMRVEEGLAPAETLPGDDIAVQRLRTAIQRSQGQYRTTLASLALLLGTTVQEVAPLVDTMPATGGFAVPAIAPGTPASLLRRRPDIAAAEAQLHAATARIGVQTASLFPQVSLTGIVELLSGSLARLVSTNSIQAVGQGQVGFPVLDFGRNRAMVGQAQAVADESYLAYRRTVLGALADAETALSQVETARAGRAMAAGIVENAGAALAAAQAAHDAGLTNLAPVLQRRLAYREAEADLVQAEASLRMATVALFKALGGGWSPTAEEPRSSGSETP